MEVVVEQEKELKQEALTITQQAALIKITDQPSYDCATSLLLEQIVPFRKKWDEYWSPLRKAAWDAHKAVMAKFNQGDEPAAQAERVVKAEIARWDQAQERIRQEAQRKAQEEAEKAEREARLDAAVVAEQAGASEEQIEEIVSAPIAVVAAPVAPTYAKTSGVSVRESWHCNVVNIKQLCAAVAKGQISVEYVQPNTSALNARARADKGTMRIPGCVAVKESIVAGRIK